MVEILVAQFYPVLVLLSVSFGASRRSPVILVLKMCNRLRFTQSWKLAYPEQVNRDGLLLALTRYRRQSGISVHRTDFPKADIDYRFPTLPAADWNPA